MILQVQLNVIIYISFIFMENSMGFFIAFIDISFKNNVKFVICEFIFGWSIQNTICLL